MPRGRRRRSPSEDSRYSETCDYSYAYSEEEEEEGGEEEESRSRSRRRNHRPRHRRHGGHSRRRRHHHRRRHRDRERDRGRDRRRARGGDGGGDGPRADRKVEGASGGSGDWHRDLKEFVRKNNLDDRTQAALRGLDRSTAKQVMGIDGGTNSFILEGVRNPDAVVMSRIRRCTEKK
uniref:Uncharacterized protein n=1 Tax=Alexandrium monilatum TaxID=311494 RepID=A0A6T1M806_9DINO|mmetsp:Transcript_38988/g.121495  ORF Transcript_38988/g.121495 Transcript_38988/m.121495 type:complete len:177 (+) Transcript_38988:97-627(+)